MSHHTNLRDAHELVDQSQAELKAAMSALIGPGGERRAMGEAARNVLLQIVADTRANFPLQRALKHMRGIFGDFAGEHGGGPTIERLLVRLQERACEQAQRAPTPLPAGVATPVPVDDDRATPLRPEVAAAQNPPNPIEVNVDRHHAPTRKVEGPWLQNNPPRRRR